MSDEEEELIDYSRLLKKAPKRGNKSIKTEENAIEIARTALFQCIEPSTKLPKQCSQGTFDPSTQWTSITVNKGTHLRTMGFSHKGVITLYPEEAAFLVSRDALIVTNQNEPFKFQDYCQVLCETNDWITFDKYQVYAYLKRLGYIVSRSKSPVPTQSIINNYNDTCSLWDLFCQHLTSWIYKNKRLPLVWDYKYTSYRKIIICNKKN